MFGQLRTDQFTVFVIERDDGMQEAVPLGWHAAQIGRVARRAVRIEDRFAAGDYIRRRQLTCELREATTRRSATTASAAATGTTAATSTGTRRRTAGGRTLGHELSNQDDAAQSCYQ
jgi:hypothetical protein